MRGAGSPFTRARPAPGVKQRSESGCCRGFGLAPGGGLLAVRTSRFRAPAPSAKKQRAYTFARRGESVACPATYKARALEAN